MGTEIVNIISVEYRASSCQLANVEVLHSLNKLRNQHKWGDDLTSLVRAIVSLL